MGSVIVKRLDIRQFQQESVNAKLLGNFLIQEVWEGGTKHIVLGVPPSVRVLDYSDKPDAALRAKGCVCGEEVLQRGIYPPFYLWDGESTIYLVNKDYVAIFQARADG